jgi:hypothetical protein
MTKKRVLKIAIISIVLSILITLSLVPQHYFHEQRYWGDRVRIIIRYAQIENVSAELSEDAMVEILERPRGDWDWEFEAYERSDLYCYDSFLLGVGKVQDSKGIDWMHISIPGIYEGALIPKWIPSLWIFYYDDRPPYQQKNFSIFLEPRRSKGMWNYYKTIIGYDFKNREWFGRWVENESDEQSDMEVPYMWRREARR